MNAREVRTRRLVIEDAEGRARIVAEANETGAPTLAFFDPQGRLRFEIAMIDDGVAHPDEDNDVCVTLYGATDGQAHLDLRRPNRADESPLVLVTKETDQDGVVINDTEHGVEFKSNVGANVGV